MKEMRLIPTQELAPQLLNQFFVEQWGSPQIVVSSGVFHCDKLEGYVMLNEEQAIGGLITYICTKQQIEVISLDSLIENKGIGSLLLSHVEQIASEKKCDIVKLITTNDNLRALQFYQKRGYQITAVYTDAVEQARKIKPEIPLIADNGIPIRDELLLVKKIRHHV